MTSNVYRLLVVLCVNSALLGTSLCAQALPTLADSDLIVAGVGIASGQAEVESLLGRPDSIAHAHGSLEWYYHGLAVSFGEGTVWLITLTTPRRQTARGLRVGDSTSRARRLYGPSKVTGGEYGYCGTESGQDRGIRLVVLHARITEIALGLVCQD